MNLDEVATSLRVRFPKCKEQVDKELARIRAEQQELAARGESDDSVDVSKVIISVGKVLVSENRGLVCPAT